jgi:high-affinity iron transporter
VFVSTFVQAAVILFREGLEALLIVAALRTYVTRTGNMEQLRAIYVGVLAAIASSVAVALLLRSLLSNIRIAWLEGLVILVAAGFMLYLSGWLFIHRGSGAWQRYLSEKTARAVAQPAGYAIATVAFLAVFREGLEIVLFTYALAHTSGGLPIEIAEGFLVGTIALVALFGMVTAVADRVPLKLAFAVSSALLFVVSIKFIGSAIHSLQEPHYISSTPIVGLGWLVRIDLNPTWEALLAQLGAIAVSAMTLTIFARMHRDEGTA